MIASCPVCKGWASELCPDCGPKGDRGLPPVDAAIAQRIESDEYASLRRILDMALQQASEGKGNERHANGRSFEDQPMQRITEMAGIGFPLGQAMKKSQEAVGMAQRGQHDAAIREILGAINYCAGAVMALEREAGK